MYWRDSFFADISHVDEAIREIEDGIDDHEGADSKSEIFVARVSLGKLSARVWVYMCEIVKEHRTAGQEQEEAHSVHQGYLKDREKPKWESCSILSTVVLKM